jgi:hypothetical protein
MSAGRLARMDAMIETPNVPACFGLVASLPKFVGSEEMLVRPLGNKTS